MLLVGKAVGGPRAGVKLECPPTWDGRILKPRKPSRLGESMHEPGKYAWDEEQGVWIWEPAVDELTHRRDGNRGVCGEGRSWPTAIPLTTNALRVTCPKCKEEMQRASASS